MGKNLVNRVMWILGCIHQVLRETLRFTKRGTKKMQVHKPNTAGNVCSSNPLSLQSRSARVYACFTLSTLQPLFGP